MFGHPDINFKKTGIEVKKAIAKRVADLEARLKKRFAALDRFISDKERIRAYLVRDRDRDYPHGAQMRRDMPSEQDEEISELCRRICRIQKELTDLKLARTHLKDKQEVELTLEELTFFGFDTDEKA